MIKVSEKPFNAASGRYLREFVLTEDGETIAAMSIELIRDTAGGTFIMIYEPDRVLPSGLYEILVRSCIAAAANTGLKLKSRNEKYCGYGFRNDGDVYTAESRDIVFPKLCKLQTEDSKP